jgi:hypothetical protein
MYTTTQARQALLRITRPKSRRDPRFNQDEQTLVEGHCQGLGDPGGDCREEEESVRYEGKEG